jgi:hypothetical protein
MYNKLIVILLLVVITSGLICTRPAFAHNFGGDESASWLAKMTEIKTEVGLIAKHVGNTGVIGYYSNVLDMYWNANDTLQMGERNTLLQTEIPSTIHTTLSDAQSGNQDAVNNDVSKLDAYLDESIPVRVDKDKLDNSTVQALAVVFVLKETLAKYGAALNSSTDLNDMSQMSMSGGSMSGMSNGMPSMSSTVIDQNSYENSIGLATAAQSMFDDLAANNAAKSDANTKISSAFTKLVQDLNNKADANTVMMDVHVKIHPAMIIAYNIQEANTTNTGVSSVPEFPLSTLLVVVSIAGVVVATRFRSLLGF